MAKRVEAEVAKRVDAEVATKVDDQLAARVNELMPCMAETLKNYFAMGGQGPLPLISLAGSNSNNLVVARDPNAPDVFVTPPASNAGAREDSPAMAPASSPSITITPAPAAAAAGPSTFAELDALTVIN